MSWTVIEADGNGVRETRRGGTLTGEGEVEPMAGPEPEPKPKLITWRKCVRIEPWEDSVPTVLTSWYPSGDIPEHWYPVEAQSQPVETIKQLPEDEAP